MTSFMACSGAMTGSGIGAATGSDKSCWPDSIKCLPPTKRAARPASDNTKQPAASTRGISNAPGPRLSRSLVLDWRGQLQPGFGETFMAVVDGGTLVVRVLGGQRAKYLFAINRGAL